MLTSALSSYYFSKYFDDWLKDKDSLSKDSIPVYILAAEGGGIRALNWTALALANLSREDSTFYNHIIAISGVSGGSIGALFYTCLINDFGKVQSDSLYTLFKGALRQDFLSPVTAALLYPDFIQRFLPFKIHYLDRARWLEDAWAKAYQSHLSKDSFNKPFLSLWNRDTSTKPCIFINGTLSETGQKAILSNIILEKKYFHDVIDIYSVINKEVLIKTAGLLSARFPLITPGGLIKSREGRPFGHIVDGGYVENTALGTAVQVLNQVLDLIDTSNHILSIGNSTKLRVKPTLIFIKNGDTNYDSMKIQKFAYEAIIPVNAFLKSWGRSGESTAYSVRQITDRVRPKIKFMKFELDRKVKNPRGKNINLPLGWFLSETAASEIARQAELLDIR